MKSQNGFLVLESGDIFSGLFRAGVSRAGEVVFNTSHAGYEEMATDPSYFSQILVTTAPQQGNYGVNKDFWESRQLWIQGFICLEIQDSPRDHSWLSRLDEFGIPTLTGVDTRQLTLKLRQTGTTWGAIVAAATPDAAKKMAKELIAQAKNIPSDWTQLVCRRQIEDMPGEVPNGPRVAVLDFGCKENILRELKSRCREIRIFPSASSSAEIKAWKPDGILLSNGPGDPENVKSGIKTTQELLGYRPMFGICMGHQVLALALGGATYKLKFGHRGSNHPIEDKILNQVYVASQNHGYNVAPESLPKSVQVTHINLNDQTVAGISDPKMKCMSVQFHPESHPGPHEAVKLFDYFVKQIT